MKISRRKEIKDKWLESGNIFCTYCSIECDFENKSNMPNMATFDHIKPVSLGGTNDINNLALSCLKCNQEKADKYQGMTINSLNAQTIQDIKRSLKDKSRIINDELSYIQRTIKEKFGLVGYMEIMRDFPGFDIENYKRVNQIDEEKAG